MQLFFISLLTFSLFYTALAQEKKIQLTPANYTKNSFPQGIENFLAPLGYTIELIMKGNPTTGYMWYLTEVDTNFLSKVGIESDGTSSIYFSDQKADATEPLVGVGGYWIFKFTTLKIGETPLSFVYKQGFSHDSPVFNYTAVIDILDEKNYNSTDSDGFYLRDRLCILSLFLIILLIFI